MKAIKLRLAIGIITGLLSTVATADVSRSQFTHGVEDREPIDLVSSITTDERKIFYFSELKDMTGQRVVHRWSYQDREMAQVTFDVGGPRWRVWSSKNLLPGWSGIWQVDVIDADGNIVQTDLFQYGE